MGILKTGKNIGVVIHHSVYKPANNLTELKAQAKLFNTWHKSKSWAEATKSEGEYPYGSYHWLIAKDGSKLPMTPEKYVKYHAGDNANGVNSFNLHGIGICVTGNFETDKPTEAEEKTLVLLIRDIQDRQKIDARVRGHKEVSLSPTACPGKNLGTSKSGWIKGIITKVNDKNYPAPVVVPKPVDWEAKYNEILKENQGLGSELESAQSVIRTKDEEILTLNSEVLELSNEAKECNDKLATAVINNKTLVNTNIELVSELAECKERDCWKEVIDKLFGWFKKNDTK